MASSITHTCTSFQSVILSGRKRKRKEEGKYVLKVVKGKRKEYMLKGCVHVNKERRKENDMYCRSRNREEMEKER